MSTANADKLKARAALLSLLAAVFLTSLKLVIGLYTNSLAILSEALHSGLDLLAALMTWYAIRVSARPADKRHPYGHGKVENLSALAETCLLFVVCGWVGYEGAHRLIEGSSPVIPSLWGVGCMLISMAVDINRVRTLKKVAKETNSQALEADALHFSTDILASAVVFAGVLAVWLAGYFQLPEPWRTLVHQADTVAALCVALIIFKVSLTMCRSALDFLMDAAPASVGDDIERAVLAVSGVMSLNRLRLRSSGPDYFVDLNVGVDPALNVAQGHRIASLVRREVRRVLPGSDVLVHVDPWRAPETPRDAYGLLDHMARRAALDVHEIRVMRQQTETDDGPVCQLTATAHVEFEGGTTFRRAYDLCREYEDACGSARPGIKVYTHIEPRDSTVPARVLRPGSGGICDIAASRIDEIVAEEPLLSNPHEIVCRVESGVMLTLSFHCMCSAMLSVRQVHDLTERLERGLRAELPELVRVFIHMEPAEPGQEEGCLEHGRHGQAAPMTARPEAGDRE